MNVSLPIRERKPWFLPNLVSATIWSFQTLPNCDSELSVFAGKILSTRFEDRNSNTSLPERQWGDTGFVLALEILASGSSTGKLYMICNLTRQNEWEELSDKEIYDDPWLLRLCEEEEPPFTVAQIEGGHGLGLLKDNWEKAYEEEEDIRLAVLSKLRPEIVETGLVKDGSYRRLVALYANPDSGKELNT